MVSQLGALLGGLCGPQPDIARAARRNANAQMQVVERHAELLNWLGGMANGYTPKPKTPRELVQEHDARLDRMMKNFDEPPTYIEKHQAEMELYA